jgi:hypothetical protein
MRYSIIISSSSSISISSIRFAKLKKLNFERKRTLKELVNLRKKI